MWISSGSELSRLHQVLDLGYGDIPGSGHDGVEVARRLVVDQVAVVIALPGVDDGEIGPESAFHQVFPAIEHAHFLTLTQRRPDPRRHVEGGDARAPGPNTLGEGTLRDKFDLQFPVQKLAFEDLVLPHIRGDHLPHLAALEQDAQSVL